MNLSQTTTCTFCNGTGYRSVAKDCGMHYLPLMQQPIGVYPCNMCDGSGNSYKYSIDLINQLRIELNKVRNINE